MTHILNINELSILIKWRVEIIDCRLIIKIMSHLDFFSLLNWLRSWFLVL
jgi:hypothetical protein